MHNSQRSQIPSDSAWPNGMVSRRQAQRILDAWEHEDIPGLRAELRLAQRSSSAATTEEEERLDLLSEIAAQMEQDLVRSRFEQEDRSAICFRLLAHLAATRPVPIRSETLSSYPYSQSVQRISASR